jgi:hypothetical protein
MTGEASPGYLPYPDVAAAIQERMPGPRIITVGRIPIERAYSSYRYNYVDPTVQTMKKGKILGIEKDQSDEYYTEYLFSFEDLMQAELAALRDCLGPNGAGVTGAEKKWGREQWAQPEYNRRKSEGLPPLVDLDGFCYGSRVSRTVPRKQWTEIMTRYPQKKILDKNMFLVQSLLGRSLYVLPLEWWYAQFDHKDLFFVCTEELSDMSGAPLAQLASFLGLPDYNFSSIVQAGAYNVGGHKGYDEEVTWDTISKENSVNKTKAEIPLSEDVLSELNEFIAPYNERLFSLIGKRCSW